LLLAPAQDLLAWDEFTQGRIAAAPLDHEGILKATPTEARLRPQLASQFQLKQPWGQGRRRLVQGQAKLLQGSTLPHGNQQLGIWAQGCDAPMGYCHGRPWGR
jgi:hypothetical protein